MRRDFGQFLAFVKTLTFLRQCHRDRTDKGAIIADIEDYADARRLLAPIFDAIIAEGITAAVRAMVAAVPLVGEITETQLAAALKLPKSTVSDRVQKAIDGGWLINEETLRGRPARLKRGVPVPNVVGALRTPERVRWAHWDHVQQRVFACSGAAAGEAGAAPPTASPEETVAADASPRPGVCLDEAYSPVLKDLHQELF